MDGQVGEELAGEDVHGPLDLVGPDEFEETQDMNAPPVEFFAVQWDALAAPEALEPGRVVANGASGAASAWCWGFAGTAVRGMVHGANHSAAYADIPFQIDKVSHPGCDWGSLNNVSRPLCRTLKMTLDEAIEATLQKWRSQGVNFRPGASAETIQFFEQTHGLVMPTDLKTYFQIADGMGGTEMWEEDSDMLAFWPLPTPADLALPDATITHVAPLPLVWSSAPETLRDLFVIGDWCIMCFAFCARITSTRSDTTEIYYYNGDPPFRIASSLGEFLQRYVEHGFDAILP
ncbi:MAG: SMI1/KNR4 family protein [Verrucomicrobiae bacterium]|nr:SMI1/KNR4 family protein [Verrucomicrobiae bacterium]